MRFGLLLIIFSIAIMIPIFFVYKEHAKKKTLQHQKQHQKHMQMQQQLKQQQDLELESNQVKQDYEQKLSLQHLPIESLPKSFQLLLLEMEQLCFALNKKQIPQEQWCTLKRLIHKHLPELIESYLMLSTKYATTHILDNNLTAEQLTYEQLKQILNFLNNSNDNVDNIKANDILVTRNYLRALYADSDMKQG